MGFLGQARCSTSGKFDRFGVTNAQWPSHSAPCSIQRLIVAISSAASDAFLRSVMEDDRLLKRIEELQALVRAKIEEVHGLPQFVWESVASFTQEEWPVVRGRTLYALHKSMAYLDFRAFRQLRQYPLLLGVGDPNQRLDELENSTEPIESLMALPAKIDSVHWLNTPASGDKMWLQAIKNEDGSYHVDVDGPCGPILRLRGFQMIETGPLPPEDKIDPPAEGWSTALVARASYEAPPAQDALTDGELAHIRQRGTQRRQRDRIAGRRGQQHCCSSTRCHDLARSQRRSGAFR